MSTENTSEFLFKAKKRLTADGYAWKDESPDFNFPFKAAATRSRFELSKFGFAEYFFVFGEADSLDVNSLRGFSSKSFELALSRRSIGLPRGLFASVWCYPVVMVNKVSAEVVKSIQETAPTKHWSAAEVPVIFETSTGKLYYFEKTPMWGAAYYAGFRKMIQKYLG